MQVWALRQLYARLDSEGRLAGLGLNLCCCFCVTLVLHHLLSKLLNKGNLGVCSCQHKASCMQEAAAAAAAAASWLATAHPLILMAAAGAAE